ncbi:MAG: valine--tRNA ligase, partial [Candidatus Omnitrophica bacterium]|nr:valine--tRNA ligase [Candidatus Omnitrophota bacterium]
MTELPSRYDSKTVETKWYSLWEKSGYFTPKIDPQKKPFTIVIPPPNVTGILHMGHALNHTIQDILIRWQRMRGVPTLWVPGVDHAGIATQNVVEKKLAQEGKNRHQLGREKFIEAVWKWKEEYGSTIVKQLRRLGASCDWLRERFTMDDMLSRAVREAFVTLYERGLIYRGDYIINWCPRCQTALSDEEAVHQEIEGALYYIKYPIASTVPGTAGTGSPNLSNLSRNVPGTVIDYVVVATTRPETMLGDTAVAINPKDERYQHLRGKKVILALLNRTIPVIEDEFVDPDFGTGIVKVTPAHDPNDFAMGTRHKLQFLNVLNPDGTINQNGGPYQGLDRLEARKKIVHDLEAQGLFVKRVSHGHAVGHCYRCHTIVEPYLSKQWFVKMKPLAEKALKAHREGKVKFYPERWNKVYVGWLENIRDWCISRQIWWGHQIPVWYCANCANKHSNKGIIVTRQDLDKCPVCGSRELKRDPDVLDTWFSSWLWPFSTLGWPSSGAASLPEKAEDLSYFYPTSVLVTAQEIIFFWVARMMMAGLEFMAEVPFHSVFIHGTVRVEGGKKMSKSLGNIIDPIEVIDEMGADALRFSLMMLAATDVYLSREKFEMGRNFTNKIWNATRFVLTNLCHSEATPKNLEAEILRSAQD